jgi:hypothetical protein
MSPRSVVGAVVYLFAAACGSNDTAAADPCDLSLIHGTYYLSFATVDGNCGAQNGALVQMTTLQPPLGAGCVVSSSSIDDQACRSTTGVTCQYPNQGETVGYDMTLHTDDGTGDTIAGLQSITVYTTATGAVVCSGNYSVTLTRQ